MLKSRIFVPAIFFAVLVCWSLPAVAEMIVDTAWVDRYNGPGNSYDIGNAMVADKSGNIYVTGKSSGGIEHDQDYFAIKYLPSGDTAWIRRYDGPGNDYDWARSIAVDDSGSVYVTGLSSPGGTDYDWATIKYYANSDTAWIRRHNGPADGSDIANSTSFDDSNNVYVTGSIEGVGTDWDCATAKYDTSGNEVWLRQYNGPGNGIDFAWSMEIDVFGSIIVTGRSLGDGTDFDYLTIKYYPNGDTAWVRRYNGPGNGYDEASGIATDISGNVYVTGKSLGDGTDLDYATIKYDQSGNEIWVRRYNGPGNLLDNAYRIVIDSLNNLYVAGESHGGAETDIDYATVKYDADGNELWVRRYNGPGNDADQAWRMTVDASNCVYVTGASYGSETGQDYATVKYSPDGNEMWVRRYNGTGNARDEAFGLTADCCNNVFVTGFSYGIGTERDCVTIKYFQALRGDVNRDGVMDLGDVVYLVSYLYKAGPAPEYMVIGDCNCDEIVDVGDVVFLINYLFKGGDPPDCP